MSGITDIKLNAYDDYKMEEWRELQERSYRMNVKILKLGQLQDTGFTVIGRLRNIFITCWIAAEVVNGNLTMDEYFCHYWTGERASLTAHRFPAAVSGRKD